MMPNNNRLKKFLERQAMIESSGGINLNHPEIKDPSSIHHGASAIGKYAIMPNTAREIRNRYKLSGLNNPELDAIDSMSDEEMKTYLESKPELQEEMAKFLAEKILNKVGGDEQMANYAWQYGHNLTPDKIKKRNYLESDRAKKYSDILLQESKQRKPANISKEQLDPTSLKLVDNEFKQQDPNLNRLNKLLEKYKK